MGDSNFKWFTIGVLVGVVIIILLMLVLMAIGV
jgi:uncharacterized membrane protein